MNSTECTEKFLLDSLDVILDLPESDAYLLRLIKLQIALYRHYDTFVEPMFNMTALRKKDAGFHSAIMTDISSISKLKWHSDGRLFDDYVKALESGLNEAIQLLKKEGKL